ncbi:cadherin-23-like [Physella acuta]|uniref:cadherin-23-like n=1 Tax=Physella acuta TaxID=109671 RepID=UPI0027DDC2DA|nr:cadherin-23-like [Physella acuta]
MTWTVFYVLLTVCIGRAVAGVPEITDFTKVVILRESTSTNELLSYISCTDPDGDPTSCFVKSMTPSFPCSGCFAVFDCSSPSPPTQQHCLQYRHGVGTLSHTLAPSYLLEIVCTDEIGKQPAREVIQVIIQANSPPYFDPDVLNLSISVLADFVNDVIYNVDGDDDENDDITYSLQTRPTSSLMYYQINSSTGEIRVVKNLRTGCRMTDTLLVFMTDGKNSVGPLVIDVKIIGANFPPSASNLETTVYVPEGSTNTIYEMIFKDPDLDVITYTVATTTPIGLAQLRVDGKNPNIDVTGSLDYENLDHRMIDLRIQLSDGFCLSPLYHLRLVITDVNEPPSISPTNTRLDVCEGKIEFNPKLKVTDQDILDLHTWRINNTTYNRDGLFAIDPSTGFIRTLADYDIDKTGAVTQRTVIVQVEDKGGLTATATVTVSFLDCNDNAPVFQFANYTTSATECTSAGTKVLQLSATDKDSSRQQNNVIHYRGSGGAVVAGSSGEIIVLHAMPAGSVVTFLVYAWDMGQTPGPLMSVNPTVVSVRFTRCPPTRTPPPIVPVPQTTALVITTETTTVLTQKKDDNLAWILIAALLGTAMLGLQGFMAWRYGPRCVRACQKFNCECSKPRRRVRRVAPAKEENIYNEPLEEPEPPGPGFLFGFWKERYPNDDFQTPPDRRNLPTPADMEPHYPHTVDPVDDPIQDDLKDMNQKKCVIL